MLVAYAIARHETSMNTLAHLLRQLAARPELQRALHEDPGLVPAAMEETLCLWTPVDHGTRVTEPRRASASSGSRRGGRGGFRG